MRKVVVYSLVSLDGVAESPDDFITTWDEDMDANLARVVGTQDTVILGRRSYDEWAAFWPTSPIEPFATFINGVEKVVATSRPLDPDWANSRVMNAEPGAFVRTLAEAPGQDIGVHASIALTQSLLAAGVVDELRLVVAPVISSSGRRLLDGVGRAHLEVIKSSTSRSGHLLVDYQFTK